MKIIAETLKILGVLGYSLPIALFLVITFLLVLSHGFFLGLFLSLLTWSIYILCIPSHHGGNTIEPLLEPLVGKRWCLSPLLWCCAVLLNVITVFVAPSIYLRTMPTHLLYHIFIMPSPGWFIMFVSGLGTFYPWIIGQDAWHKPKYGQIMFYYFLKLLGIYVFFTFAYPQWVVIMNLIGSR